jgi:catechol 2,3-dioxygenase-like lactoylglutathione lyase family enzyme
MTQEGASPLELKVVIRCRDFQASRRFYGDILDLPVLESWEEQGGQGCIFGFGPQGQSGSLEVYQMREGDRRYSPVFAAPFENDKIDLQLRTTDLEGWMAALRGVWEFSGPQRLPWGERRITLRDPDNLLISIYQSE